MSLLSGPELSGKVPGQLPGDSEGAPLIPSPWRPLPEGMSIWPQRGRSEPGRVTHGTRLGPRFPLQGGVGLQHDPCPCGLGHLVSLHAKWQGVLAAHCLVAADQASLWSPAQATLLQPGPACSPWSLRSGDSGDRSFRGRTVIADPRVTGPLGCPWRTFLGHWTAQRLELKLL